MELPPATLVRQFDTHRLVPSVHAPRGDSVLVAIADDDEHLQAIFELDAATNDRVLAEHERLPGIGLEELVFAVPHAAVINAAFCHAHPLGSRFSGPDRGAWYAAFELATSQAEVGFHKSVQLAEIGRFEDTVTFDDYLADFSASFEDLRPGMPGGRRVRGPTALRRDPSGGTLREGPLRGRTASRRGRVAGDFRACLAADSYVASQALAARLLAAGSLGVVYPSVRRAGGTCLACFRPALVANVRRAKTYRFTWEGKPDFVVSESK